MRGCAFCYHHARRIPPSRKLAPSSEMRVEIPAVLDRNGINLALHHVLQALANGRISPRRASMLLYGLRIAVDDPSSALPGSVSALPPSDQPGAGETSDQDVIDLVNSMAAKLGLDSDALPEAPAPKG